MASISIKKGSFEALEKFLFDLLHGGLKGAMKKPSTPQELAVDIMGRSKCAVQVGAVVADRHGIFSWGWNYDGPNGMGLHAEEHAINRANHRRCEGASIYVAGQRKRNWRKVEAKPCDNCMQRIVASGIKRVYWRGKDGNWKMIYTKGENK